MRILLCLFLALLCWPLEADAQLILGGRNTYDFLSLPHSGRVTALGGNLITIKDHDVALAYQNPALLNPQMHNHLSVQQNVHVAGITYGYAGYGYHIKPVPLTVHGGIKYVSYGQFERRNNIGDPQGNFSASEFAVGFGAGYQASERFSMGVNLKLVLSNLADFNSTGWASDWGMHYEDTAKRISVGFVLRNVGTQLSTYNRDKNMQRLPFDAQLGFAHQLKYLPLRFSIIGHHLHRWNILYDDPALADNNTLVTTNEPTPDPGKMTFGKGIDNVFRHLIFNMELLLGKSEAFRIRLGYSRLRQGQLGVSGLRTLAGFSTGIGVKVYKFQIDYGLSAYHISGMMHHFGISTNFSEF